MTISAKVEPARIVFVLIDLQPTLLERISTSKTIVRAAKLLLETAQVLSVPRIATSQDRKRLGDIADGLAPFLPEPVLDKRGFSCTSLPEFQKRLQETGRNSVVIAGIETHICVMQTCLDLLNKDFQVAIVTDAVGAGGVEDHLRGLDRMEKSGALLVTTEMLIYELLGSSENEAFKKLLPKIKELKQA
jgi:nicotinamidase-related amidase